jgi:glycosyltransferase involved in cell wall biosynthesis
MKIAILGTRGIPNNYGGFEQLAQYLSLGLKEKGHDVYVYSSHKHKYQEKTWKGIHIIHKYDPESRIGAVGQFIYDFNSILNSRKHRFDVILNLGYTSSSVWMRLFSTSAKIITNMDGLEWKRSKYSPRVQRFLMYAEKLAVKHSDLLVADSEAIQRYLERKYGVQSHFIAYGAKLFDQPDPHLLERFNLLPFAYNMLIARMEPENNIEMILEGVAASGNSAPFLVVGNYHNKFGRYLHARFRNDRRIVFTGPIYDPSTVNNLRYFSNIYFHGHSVGGTNPSLLEAMGCNSLVAAHDNEFNRSVLGNEAYYFSAPAGISQLIDNIHKQEPQNEKMLRINYERIRTCYSWERIVHQYEDLMRA